MLARIKRILLTQYIGAIVTALIAAQGISGLISLLVFPLSWHLMIRRGEPGSQVWHMPGTPQAYDWSQTIVSLVSVTLHFLVVYILMRWLYFEEEPSPKTAKDLAGSP
jgi:hypothetical protein